MNKAKETLSEAIKREFPELFEFRRLKSERDSLRFQLKTWQDQAQINASEADALREENAALRAQLKASDERAGSLLHSSARLAREKDALRAQLAESVAAMTRAQAHIRLNIASEYLPEMLNATAKEIADQCSAAIAKEQGRDFERDFEQFLRETQPQTKRGNK
jgi:hypothetical protein